MARQKIKKRFCFTAILFILNMVLTTDSEALSAIGPGTNIEGALADKASEFVKTITDEHLYYGQIVVRKALTWKSKNKAGDFVKINDVPLVSIPDSYAYDGEGNLITEKDVPVEIKLSNYIDEQGDSTTYTALYTAGLAFTCAAEQTSTKKEELREKLQEELKTLIGIQDSTNKNDGIAPRFCFGDPQKRNGNPVSIPFLPDKENAVAAKTFEKISSTVSKDVYTALMYCYGVVFSLIKDNKIQIDEDIKIGIQENVKEIIDNFLSNDFQIVGELNGVTTKTAETTNYTSLPAVLEQRSAYINFNSYYTAEEAVYKFFPLEGEYFEHEKNVVLGKLDEMIQKSPVDIGQAFKLMEYNFYNLLIDITDVLPNVSWEDTEHFIHEFEDTVVSLHNLLYVFREKIKIAQNRGAVLDAISGEEREIVSEINRIIKYDGLVDRAEKAITEVFQNLDEIDDDFIIEKIKKAFGMDSDKLKEDMRVMMHKMESLQDKVQYDVRDKLGNLTLLSDVKINGSLAILAIHILKSAEVILEDQIRYKDLVETIKLNLQENLDSGKKLLYTSENFNDTLIDEFVSIWNGAAYADVKREPSSLGWFALENLLRLDIQNVGRYSLLTTKAWEGRFQDEYNSLKNFIYISGYYKSLGSMPWSGKPPVIPSIVQNASLDATEALFLFGQVRKGRKISPQSTFVNNYLGGLVVSDTDAVFTMLPVPIDIRPPVAFIWSDYAHKLDSGNEDIYYHGVDYLFAYSLGKYYGYLKDQLPPERMEPTFDLSISDKDIEVSGSLEQEHEVTITVKPHYLGRWVPMENVKAKCYVDSLNKPIENGEVELNLVKFGGYNDIVRELHIDANSNEGHRSEEGERYLSDNTYQLWGKMGEIGIGHEGYHDDSLKVTIYEWNQAVLRITKYKDHVHWYAEVDRDWSESGGDLKFKIEITGYKKRDIEGLPIEEEIIRYGMHVGTSHAYDAVAGKYWGDSVVGGDNIYIPYTQNVETSGGDFSDRFLLVQDNKDSVGSLKFADLESTNPGASVVRNVPTGWYACWDPSDTDTNGFSLVYSDEKKQQVLRWSQNGTIGRINGQVVGGDNFYIPFSQDSYSYGGGRDDRYLRIRHSAIDNDIPFTFETSALGVAYNVVPGWYSVWDNKEEGDVSSYNFTVKYKQKIFPPQIKWKIPSYGDEELSHKIYVVIDPANTIVEENEDNNSAVKAITILPGPRNYPPTTPRLTGPDIGMISQTHTFTASSSDPEGQKIKFVFKWGDEISHETAYLDYSGDLEVTGALSHAWNSAGSYNVTVQAIDESGKASAWSNPLSLVIYSPPPGWSSDENLTQNEGNSILPCIVSEGENNVYMVWQDSYKVWNARKNIYDWYGKLCFKKSIDGGISWTSAVSLAGVSNANPKLAVDGNGYLHLVYGANGALMYRRSTDKGATWGSYVTLAPTFSSKPAICASGNNIYVAWADAIRHSGQGFREISFKKSVNGGNNWSNKLSLSPMPGISDNPTIASDGQNVYLAWYYKSGGSGIGLFSKSSDGGDTWGPVHGLGFIYSPIYEAMITPRMIVDPAKNLHLTWANRVEGGIYYARSVDQANNWSVQRLMLTEGAEFPDIITDDSRGIHIVWTDKHLDKNYEVYYKESLDNGNIWQPEFRLTFADKDSTNPSVAVTPQAVHIAWQDNRSGNNEIYYIRHVAPKPFSITNVSCTPNPELATALLDVPGYDQNNPPFKNVLPDQIWISFVVKNGFYCEHKITVEIFTNAGLTLVKRLVVEQPESLDIDPSGGYSSYFVNYAMWDGQSDFRGMPYGYVPPLLMWKIKITAQEIDDNGNSGKTTTNWTDWFGWDAGHNKIIPKQYLAIDANGSKKGLRAEYSNSIVISGEGPINHGVGGLPGHIPPIGVYDEPCYYQGLPGYWAKKWDVFGIFSEKLTGYIYAPETGVYKFKMVVDDYAALVVNGWVICTYDNIEAPGETYGQIPLQGGRWYPIYIEYANRKGSNGLGLYWNIAVNQNFIFTDPTFIQAPGKDMKAFNEFITGESLRPGINE